MANIKSQKKRIITNEKSRMRNRAVKAALTAMDSDIRRKPAAVPCCACLQLKLA